MRRNEEIEAIWPKLQAFHSWLHEPGERGKPSGRATRARWRREHDAAAIALDQDFFLRFYPIFLHGRTPDLGRDEANGRLDAILGMASAFAAVPAVVKNPPIARQMAGNPNDGVLVAAGRFRRVIESDGPRALAANLHPLYGLLRKGANLKDLSASFLQWDERRKRQWAYDYYTNIPSTNGEQQ